MEDTTRILSETPYAAGKGIDVSRVIRELGGQSVALGLVGGFDGMQLEGLLINAGVMTDFTMISGETRTNIILREQAKNRQYAISAAGPAAALAWANGATAGQIAAGLGGFAGLEEDRAVLVPAGNDQLAVLAKRHAAHLGLKARRREVVQPEGRVH